ncbi:hypothetical protein AVEN_106646-1 [Araneus ventricosus]|uniref:Uncharacterized protein n=1 Tax=Araneus ventricosus TaxID=182803 RepID=A0A4Y2GEZ5_ARAVE|nr:hypothetical protein AVEN_57958-1 [Araneus ventricosus]GBM50584.1 hypothetical protein AVEN_106646-1 [Araneus ventricosus]
MINLARAGFAKNGSFKRNKSAVLDTMDTATTAMLISTYSSYDGTSRHMKIAILAFVVRWALGEKSKLILLRIASRPSRPSGAPDPGGEVVIRAKNF